MKPPNSSTAFPRLTALTLLTILLQISDAAPKAAFAGLPIRATPIDSPPETNGLAAPIVVPANLIAAKLSPTNSLPHPEMATSQTNRGCLEIGFDKLSGFPARVIYEEGVSNGVRLPHVTKMSGEIPQTIKLLDNRKVAVKGFMLPLKQENGLATDFILLRSRMMCCYGMIPNINEWIHVRMDGKGAQCIMDTPVTIRGKLHVEEFREDGSMVGIYRLDGEKLEAPGGP
jgi:hypothetical protein